MQQTPRNYSSLIERVQKSLLEKISIFSKIGKIHAKNNNYDIVKIITGKGNSKKVLITAGIHGDEVAGVNTIVQFLEKHLYEEFVDQWELTFIPCLNPTGYVQNTRTNHADKDLNRLFKDGQPPREVAISQDVLNSPFDLTLDLHEDLDTPGLYIYMKEFRTTDTALGKKIINAMKEYMPINMAEEIEGTPAKGGLISDLPDPEEMDWWPMAMYAIDRGSKTSFTIETSTNYSIETRVGSHISAIQTAIRNHTNFR